MRDDDKICFHIVASHWYCVQQKSMIMIDGICPKLFPFPCFLTQLEAFLKYDYCHTLIRLWKIWVEINGYRNHSMWPNSVTPFQINSDEINGYRNHSKCEHLKLSKFDVNPYWNLWTIFPHESLQNLWASKPTQNLTWILSEICGQICHMNPYRICEHLNLLKIWHKSLLKFVDIFSA